MHFILQGWECFAVRSIHLSLSNILKIPLLLSFVQFPADSSSCGALAAACQPATFGVEHEDVLDETYRKAGKMDRGEFSISFESALGVFLEQAAKQLLGISKEGVHEEVFVELYKLNVYGPITEYFEFSPITNAELKGPGSFFKSHKDTPRSELMFGSLVVFLPTEYKGGELLLRQEGKEFKYDYSVERVRAGHLDTSGYVGWIAFYSDIEHEVLPVEEGYRVTLTYVRSSSYDRRCQRLLC